jgi:putative thioredoxin
MIEVSWTVISFFWRRRVSSPSSDWIIDVDTANFERAVIERSRDRPVVVDFWAAWCSPCLMLGPVLEKLVSERKGEVILAKVNIDEAQELAHRYAVEAIPAVKAFRDGKPIFEFMGVLPETAVRQLLDRICPTESDRLARQASALEATRPEQAESLYRRALELDRNHEVAGVGLARLLIGHGRDAEAAEVLAPFGPGGEQGEEVERLNAILFLRQQAREYGEESAARQRWQADPNNARLCFQFGCILAAAGKYPEALEMLLSAGEKDRQLAAGQVRETMVKIFQVIGVRSPLSDQYRDKLSHLLY